MYVALDHSTSWEMALSLCGLGRANEGVIGTAVLKDNHGTVLAQVSPMFVPNSGFLFALFDFPSQSVHPPHLRAF